MKVIDYGRVLKIIETNEGIEDRKADIFVCFFNFDKVACSLFAKSVKWKMETRRKR